MKGVCKPSIHNFFLNCFYEQVKVGLIFVLMKGNFINRYLALFWMPDNRRTTFLPKAFLRKKGFLWENSHFLLVGLKICCKRKTLRDFYIISNRLPVSIPGINDFPSINVCSRGFFAICLVTRGFAPGYCCLAPPGQGTVQSIQCFWVRPVRPLHSVRRMSERFLLIRLSSFPSVPKGFLRKNVV